MILLTFQDSIISSYTSRKKWKVKLTPNRSKELISDLALKKEIKNDVHNNLVISISFLIRINISWKLIHQIKHTRLLKARVKSSNSSRCEWKLDKMYVIILKNRRYLMNKHIFKEHSPNFYHLILSLNLQQLATLTKRFCEDFETNRDILQLFTVV